MNEQIIDKETKKELLNNLKQKLKEEELIAITEPKISQGEWKIYPSCILENCPLKNRVDYYDLHLIEKCYETHPEFVNDFKSYRMSLTVWTLKKSEEPYKSFFVDEHGNRKRTDVLKVEVITDE